MAPWSRGYQAARDWLAERDIHCFRGPANPSLNHELGLLIDGFDSSPTFMMTYNHPYYEKLIENFGFVKTQDLYAYWGHIDMLPKINERLTPISEQIVERLDLKIRPLNKSNFVKDVMAFLDIYNQSLGNTWGFVPLSDAEVRHTAAGLKHLMIPELALAAEVDGKWWGLLSACPITTHALKTSTGAA